MFKTRELDTRTNLTPEDVAGRLGTNRHNVVKWMRAGRLKSINIGTGERVHLRTSEAWLSEFCEAQTAGAGK